MSVGVTLFKIGLTGAIVGGVLLTARHYHRQALARARGRVPKPLPAPEPEPPGGCSSLAPVFDDQGVIAGTWLDSQTPGECVLSCVEGYVLGADGQSCVRSGPAPEPDEFPAPDACVAGLYSRAPLPPEAKMYEAADQSTRLVLEDLLLHLDYQAQPKLMLDLLDRVVTEPSVRSVMVRRVLEELAPDCDWWIPVSEMLPSQQHVYADSLALSLAAETEMGWEHPQTARKNMVPREYLGMPSSGVLQLAPGQAVELLVVEGPEMEFGEHLIAKTLQGGPNPRVVIVDTFMGRDIAPRLAPYHGFDVGTQVVLESTPPTSAYRVYPKDWA